MTITMDGVVQYLVKRLGMTAELEVAISEIPGFTGWPAPEVKNNGTEELLERIAREGKIDIKNGSQIIIHRSINY
jgi:hypothetical protein